MFDTGTFDFLTFDQRTKQKLALTVSESTTSVDTVTAAVSVASIGQPTPVRDHWDRDAWGNFIPGSGFH